MNPFEFLRERGKPAADELREAYRSGPQGPWAVEQVVGNKNTWKYSLSDELFKQYQGA